MRGLEQAERAVRSMESQLRQWTEPTSGNRAGPASPSTPIRQSPPTPPPGRVLRPPGAASDADFLDACTRCGRCVAACPARCIYLDDSPQPLAGGAPYIVARHSPCVICDDLACMTACPSGALAKLADRRDIRMGLAVVDQQACLRSRDDDCHLCINHCPIGVAALVIDDASRIAVLEGCTGCGVCEWVCPTHPAAIVVHPRMQSREGPP